MNKFHSIPTDKYVPISYDNAYLFDQYERINNFLIFNVDKKFKNILSKPVKSNFEVDWYSTYRNLEQLEASPARDFGLREYWILYEELQIILKQISRTNDENVKSWVEIIQTTFDPKNNLIFTNGKEISIIWGWKFENNRNQKPDLLANSGQDIAMNNEPEADSPFLPPIFPNLSSESVAIKEVEEPSEEVNHGALEETYYDEREDVDLIKKMVFSDFLKHFASKYSWVLIVLLTLVCIVFFIKSLLYN